MQNPLLFARLRCIAYFCLTGALGSVVLLEEEEEGCCRAWSRLGCAVPFLRCKVWLGWGGSGNRDILNPAAVTHLGAFLSAEISGVSPVPCVPGPPRGMQQPGRYRQGAGGGCWSCLGWGRVLGSLPSSPRPGRYRQQPQSRVSAQRPPRAGLAASFVGFVAQLGGSQNCFCAGFLPRARGTVGSVLL